MDRRPVQLDFRRFLFRGEPVQIVPYKASYTAVVANYYYYSLYRHHRGHKSVTIVGTKCFKPVIFPLLFFNNLREEFHRTLSLSTGFPQG